MTTQTSDAILDRMMALHPKVIEIARNATKAIADVSDTASLTQVTENHAHKVRPGVNSLVGLVCFVLIYQFIKRIAGQKADDLAEKRYFCHGLVWIMFGKTKIPLRW